MPDFDVARFDSLHVAGARRVVPPAGAAAARRSAANLSASREPEVRPQRATPASRRSDNRIEPESDLIIALYYTGMQNYGFKGCPGLRQGPTQSDGSDGTASAQRLPAVRAGRHHAVRERAATCSASPAASTPTGVRSPGCRTTARSASTSRPSNFFHLCRLNECPPQSATARVGNVTDNRQTNRNFSAKVASTSTWNATPWANLKTTVGARLHEPRNGLRQHERHDAAAGRVDGRRGVDVQSQSSSSRPRRRRSASTCRSRRAFRDRLFLTVAARSDQNSAFGTNFQQRRLPEGERVVARVGRDRSSRSYQLAEPVPPPQRRTAPAACSRAARRVSSLFTPARVTHRRRAARRRGTDTPGLIGEQPGQREPQAGTFRRARDAASRRSCCNNRVHFDYTYYNKKTHDALISVPIAAVGRRVGHEPAAERRLDAELGT